MAVLKPTTYADLIQDMQSVKNYAMICVFPDGSRVTLTEEELIAMINRIKTNTATELDAKLIRFFFVASKVLPPIENESEISEPVVIREDQIEDNYDYPEIGFLL